MNLFKGFKNLLYLLSSKKKYLFFFENSATERHFFLLLKKINFVDYDIVCCEKSLSSKNFDLYNLYSYYLLVILFTLIKNKIILMTTPDLGNHFIKKKKTNTYIYAHHSICSTHMIYNENAFDKFDVIFNVGDFQNNEIREREKIFKLPKKKLVNYGYGKLDLLIKKKENIISDEVCIAPSWNVSDKYLDFVELLIIKNLKNYKVRFRPHNHSLKFNKRRIVEIINKFSNDKNFYFDRDADDIMYIYKAKYFFSDWSGAAFEYAFSRLRPVIFFSSPKKINNKNYEKICIEPIEVKLRSKIGEIITEDSLNDVDILFQKIDRNLLKYENMILETRTKLIFNLNSSADIGANILSKL